MARKKVNLAWIQNDGMRRTTFKKRRHGLIKKMSEITTLCDVKACAVIYGMEESELEVWPSMPEVKNMVQSFLQQPQINQCKKMMNQENFLELKGRKLNEQHQRAKGEILNLELGVLAYECICNRNMNELSQTDATNLLYFVDTNLKKICELMNAIMEKEGSSSENPNSLVEHDPSHILFLNNGTSNVN